MSAGFASVVGTDLHLPSDRSWRRDTVDYIVADAASCFRAGTFDLIAFNPPYLPSEDIVDDAVDGGPGGGAVAMRFVLEAIRVMRSGGRVVMLLSSDSPVESVRELCERNGLAMKQVDSRHLFYETLRVYELRR